jgi:hypothetical protein
MPHLGGNQGSHEVEVDSKDTDTAVAQSAEDRYQSLLVASMYKDTAVGVVLGEAAVSAETVEEQEVAAMYLTAADTGLASTCGDVDKGAFDSM